jgi:hypothetical protein
MNAYPLKKRDFYLNSNKFEYRKIQTISKFKSSWKISFHPQCPLLIKLGLFMFNILYKS